MRRFFVYILASRRNGTLYIGVTNNLVRRVWEHRNNAVDGFTRQHAVHTLVYYETCDNAEVAIGREKQLKAWRRSWKIALIEGTNPEWRDLWGEIHLAGFQFPPATVKMGGYRDSWIPACAGTTNRGAPVFLTKVRTHEII